MAKICVENRTKVKTELVRAFADGLDEILDIAYGSGDIRTIEKGVVSELCCVGRLTLGYLFGLRCQQASVEDIERRGLSDKHVRIRTDEDYWGTTCSCYPSVRPP